MATSQYNSYIVAPDPVDIGVQSIIAGSNIRLTGTATNPIINSTQWPSVFGSKTVNSGVVATNNFTVLFQIANSYFSDQTRRYLLTVNFVLPSGTFAAAATGNLAIGANYNSAYLCQQPMTFNNVTSWSNTGNTNFCGSMTTTFLPTVNQSMNINLINTTSAQLTTANCIFDVSITGLTTSNISANNWP